MNNLPDLSVPRSLELLAQLQKTSAAYAEREEAHFKDFAARRHGVNRKHRDEAARTEAAWATRLKEAEAVFDRQEAQVKARYDNRRAQLKRIEAKFLRNLPQRAKEAKGKWLGKLQMKEIISERDKVAGLTAADAEAAAFAARLGRRNTDIVSLKHGASGLFAGYPSFQRIIEEQLRAPGEKPSGPMDQWYDELKARIRTTDEHLKTFRQFPLPRLFRVLQLPVLITFVLIGAAVLGFALRAQPMGWPIAGGAAVVLIIALVALYQAGRKQALPAVQAFAAALARARDQHAACVEASAQHHQDARKAVEDHYAQEHKIISERWAWAGTVESQFEQSVRDKIQEQMPRVLEKNDVMARPKIKRVVEARAARMTKLKADAAAEIQGLLGARDEALAQIAHEETDQWAALEKSWQGDTAGLARAITDVTTAASVPAWGEAAVEAWQPPVEFPHATRFAELHLAGPQSAPKRLAASTQAPMTVPVALTLPGRGCLLFETNETGTSSVIGTLNNLILRILSAMPPGKVSFTIIDPVGLGQSFAGLMHLADYEEAIINRRIWTQRDQIEERLSELNEHIEKVIQMYLRNEYANITAYNEQAGSVAEKYHFLVVADFPANFSDVAAKRLQSIAASGARCGVFTLIHWDQRQPSPDGFVPDELRKHSICIRSQHGVLTLAGQPQGSTLVLDPPPTDEVAAALVHKIGQSSVDSNRVQVPFEQIAPKAADYWTNDTTLELKVPIGRTGATKQQMLAIGKGTRQHALFAGKTGSGKSTLFHVIITNLALSCSPEQVEFYLIDFKKGVEFKCYATNHLPHARVIAIESDREFALSVLQRVDEELKRRGDMFRKLGAQDIAGYKRAGGTEPMPRSLLMIDEFQEFFVEDDPIAQTASVLFDRIVRQGRAFGIHVLLGSQTLGGAYTLARATMGQMVIRVALQCNEADAHLIMDENNSAPRLLSRPGEGIYNDAAGVVEGNSPFQVVWLSDENRDRYLEQVRALADERGNRHGGPIVFEGNAPAEVRENHLLASAIDTAPAKVPANPRCWLGAPNAIKGPTEAVFHRQGGNHLLIVGQRDEAVTTMFGLSLLSLAAQYPPGTAKFVLLLGANPGSPDAEFFERIAAGFPHEIKLVRPHEIADAMATLGAELQARQGADVSAAPATFVFIHGLHRFKKIEAGGRLRLLLRRVRSHPRRRAEQPPQRWQQPRHPSHRLGRYFRQRQPFPQPQSHR